MSDIGFDKAVAFWKDEIENYERIFDKFRTRGRKIYKRYRDIRSPREEAVTRFNIFWSNVQTRMPALYARNPKAVVERRFKDRDPVGRQAAEVLERSIDYTLEHCNDTYAVNRAAVLDFELPGRGTTWVRYVPHFHKEELDEGEDDGQSGKGAAPVSDEEAAEAAGRKGDTEHGPEVELPAMGEEVSNEADDEIAEETLRYEETKLDYIYWEDFGHTWARTWAEVRAVWKRVYMDRDELRERFLQSEQVEDGLTEDEIAEIPLDWSPKNLTDTKIPQTRKKAIVYEIWDKQERKVLWVVKNFRKCLDQRKDPLGLDNFFPCPRPLYANLVNDELMPTPNLAFYQDQANEIDELSSRIASITKALKVAGVRDTSAEGLDRLLAEGVENQLVPVEGWAVLKEKGGLKGVYELLPMEEIALTLGHLREQRQELINDVYQLTGISDIVRGLSDPNETATAQQLKGQFSIIRIQDAQQEVQRFCRDQIRIVGQIVAGYDIETLKMISGIKLLTNAEKAMLKQQMAMQAMGAPPPQPGVPQPPHPMPQGMQSGGVMPAQAPHPPMPGAPPAPQGAMPGQGPSPAAPAPGQAPAPQSQPQQLGLAILPPPIDPVKQRLMELPSWEDVEALLANPVFREFRLDIESDSTIRMDEEMEKAARLELMGKTGEFLQQAVMAGAQAPEVIPMLGELIMFVIRGFKAARQVEQTFEDALESLQKAAKQPKPNPEMQKAQAQMQIEQMKAQVQTHVEQAKQQAQAQQNSQEQQLEMVRKQRDAELEAQVETHKAQMQAQTQMALAHMNNQFEAQRVQFETAAKERLEMMKLTHEAQTKHAEMQHQAAQASAIKLSA
jgi:hypothetical protein